MLVYTSRTLKGGGLETAREVSAAVTEVVQAALGAHPAWVIAKGGITSHDVAVKGLGIRRATVLGQLLPGMVSVFRPQDADERAVGMPYVVFAGNVGDERTLAEIVERFARRLMLATGTDMLQRGHAVAAITTYTLESTRGDRARRRAARAARDPVGRARARTARSGASRSPPPRWRRRVRRRCRSACISTTAAIRRRSTPASRSATAR